MASDKAQSTPSKTEALSEIAELADIAEFVDYSLMQELNSDPDATVSFEDYAPRQVFSGHFVPVKPTPIAKPIYVAHSEALFRELNLADSLAHTEAFQKLFSGDLSDVPPPIKKHGWATGYALSIYGTEYTQQCPFRTGNGYGDGRAVSVLEVLIHGKRWEMQLKGGGRTPYCRGADGRAVLRSSVREFLAQEHMHALGVPTSRSLCLFVSESETVDRPWYSEGSEYADPDIMVSNPVAITTRVAPSFLRVGQLELFGRRARNNAHPKAMEELRMIVQHAMDREYSEEFQSSLTEDSSFEDKLMLFAGKFRDRLISLVTNWIRVGYCQGNFNSDNCAVGGFTLDYGPFGFCERFEPFFQPWTGGGRHFSFLNQPAAAKANFEMFCKALEPLLSEYPPAMDALQALRSGFAAEIKTKQEEMWAAKLGLDSLDSKFDYELFSQLLELMVQTSVDYTIFFRELSSIPDDLSALTPSFYETPDQELAEQWKGWLANWRKRVSAHQDLDSLSEHMKRVNPKYTWREWLVVPAYQQAAKGDYSLIQELQQVLNQPYDEQTKAIENKYYRLRPKEYFQAGGVSHYSCSS